VTISNEQEKNHANRISRDWQQGVMLRPVRLLCLDNLLCADNLLRPVRLLRHGRLLRADGLLRANAAEGRLR
jgi:hypothetical protein